MEKFNIENDYVYGFIHNEKYEDGYGHGTGATKVKTYLYKIKQNTPGSLTAYTPNDSERSKPIDLTVSTKTNGITSNESIKVYNLLPDKEYTTELTFGGVTSKVSYQTTGQLRMIYTNRVYNMRDIGGWSVGQNKRIKYGKLIRSAELGGLADTTIKGVKEDIEMLTKNVGINVEMDIRGKSESYCKTLLGNGVKFYGGNSTYACQGYNSLLTNVTPLKNTLVTIIDELKKGSTILIHCSQGADRTGCLFMIIEALCGASEDTLIKDWELTSFVDYLNTKYISDSDELRYVFQQLYNNYGGKEGKNINEQVENWLLNKVKMTKTQLDTLRSLLVETITPEPQPEPEPQPTPLEKITITNSMCSNLGGYVSLNGQYTTTGSSSLFYAYYKIDPKYYGKALHAKTTYGGIRLFSFINALPTKNGQTVSKANNWLDKNTYFVRMSTGTSAPTEVDTTIPIGNDNLYIIISYYKNSNFPIITIG